MYQSVCACADNLRGPYATFLVMSKFCSSCSVLVFLPAGNIASAYIGVSSLVWLVSTLLDGCLCDCLYFWQEQPHANPITKATMMNNVTDESIAAMATVLRFSTGPGIVVLDPVHV